MYAGSDQGQRDSVGRRSRLLPGKQRRRVGGECRKRAPLHTSSRADNTSKCARNEESLRDTFWEGYHLKRYAGKSKIVNILYVWMNEWVFEWMNECLNEWMSVWMNE